MDRDGIPFGDGGLDREVASIGETGVADGGGAEGHGEGEEGDDSEEEGDDSEEEGNDSEEEGGEDEVPTEPGAPWEPRYWDSSGYEPDCFELLTTHDATHGNAQDWQPRDAAYAAQHAAVSDWNAMRKEWLEGFKGCPDECKAQFVYPEPKKFPDRENHTLPTDPAGATNLTGPTFCVPTNEMKYGRIVHACSGTASGHVAMMCMPSE